MRMVRAGKRQKAIPESVRQALAGRLLRHVNERWNGRVRKILLRFHGRYAYVAVVEAAPAERVLRQVCRHTDPGEIPTEFCRLGYLGMANGWEFAFFKYSGEKYEPFTLSGSFLATPEEAFDCSALYLQPADGEPG